MHADTDTTIDPGAPRPTLADCRAAIEARVGDLGGHVLAVYLRPRMWDGRQYEVAASGRVLWARTVVHRNGSTTVEYAVHRCRAYCRLGAGSRSMPRTLPGGGAVVGRLYGWPGGGGVGGGFYSPDPVDAQRVFRAR